MVLGAGRARCALSEDQAVSLLKANVRQGTVEDEANLTADEDSLAETFKDFLRNAFAVTDRLNAATLEKALPKVFAETRGPKVLAQIIPRRRKPPFPAPSLDPDAIIF